MNLTERPATAEDRPFLLDLYASTRESEMALVPWTTDQKRAFVESQFAAQCISYAESYPDAVQRIVLAGDTPAGRLYVSFEPNRIHLLDITIAPARRNSGIGSQVLKNVVKRAEESGQPVSIYVESFNPSLSLFERLGFRSVSQNGFHLLLERRPSGSSAAESHPPREARQAGC